MTLTGNDQYLLEMSMMVHVLGLKEREIVESGGKKWANAADYYGLWQIDGAYGPFKYWRQSRFDDKDTVFNSYQVEYSQ